MRALSVATLASWWAGAGAVITSSAQAGGSLLEEIFARGHLRVGTTGSYAPFSHLVSNATDNGTSFIGADIDMAMSLASALGFTSSSPSVVFVPTTFADRANFPAADIVVYADNTDIFRALLNQTADVVVTDRVEAELCARLHRGTLCAVCPESPYSFEELGYVLPRDVAWLQFVNT